MRTDYLDGWRGISIACVLQGHFIQLPFDLGAFGVNMFFCLSGMLMGNLLFIQRQPLPSFYRRRISRIFPAFVVFVVAMFALSDFWGRTFQWTEFWATLFFVRTYFPYPGIWKTGMPLGHIWSLNVEEHSYMFMSFLGLVPIFRQREWCVLMLCGTACIVTGFLYVRLGAIAPFWGGLGTEVAASYLLISSGYSLICNKVRKYIPPWLPLLTLVAAIVISQRSPWWLQPMASPFLLAFSVNHLSETAEWFRSALSKKLLCKIGLWSFSIYLWQQPFYSIKSTLPGGPLVALASAFGVALLSFYMVEKPSRTWLNKNWRSWDPLKALVRNG